MKTKIGTLCFMLIVLALPFAFVSAQDDAATPTVDHAAHHSAQETETPEPSQPMDEMGQDSGGMTGMMQPMMGMMDMMMGMDMSDEMRDRMNQMRGMMDMMSMMDMMHGGDKAGMMQPMMGMMDMMMGMDMSDEMRDRMNQMRGMMDMMMGMMSGGGENSGGGHNMAPLNTEAAPDDMDGMAMEMDTDYSVDDLAPLALAYYNGGDVYFIHPEASDPGVADVLTAMMGTDVIAVSSLGQIPAELLGKVYVFTNGIAGMGPLGFQPDVFDSVPDVENYTPLRAVQLVTWQDGAEARELTSVDDILVAEAAGELVIEAPGVVVNMSILVWPGGQR